MQLGENICFGRVGIVDKPSAAGRPSPAPARTGQGAQPEPGGALLLSWPRR